MFEKFVTKAQFENYQQFKEEFDIKIPERFNFAYDVLDVLAEENPDKTALVWCNDENQDRIFTYADIKRCSNKTANFFKELGIKKGDPVMLVLKRRYEYWFCVMALHKIGAIVIPATHQLTTKDFIYRNNMADIKMIVSVGEAEVMSHVDQAELESPSLKYKVALGSADSMSNGWISFDDRFEKASSEFERPTGEQDTKVDDFMIFYFTSGTTGYPKIVAHDFSYPLGHIITAKYWHNLNENSLHFTVADTGWAKSSWGKLYGQWLCKASIFVYDYSSRFVPKDLLEVMQKYKVTSFCAPPTIYRFLIKEDFSQYDLSSLEYCTIAGEPLNPEIFNRFVQLTGLKPLEGFGQTEAVVMLANFPWMEPRPGSMGKPSPCYDIEIVDNDGNTCDIGEEGQVIIRTDKKTPPGLFRGYYKDERLTESMWNNGVYYTGDIAWQDEDGYYWFVGRADDVIKSSGYRIGPFEVESALIEHPAVMETAIVGVPDEIRGQIVKASVILAKGYEPSDRLKKELQEHVKKVTAPYKYPRIIEFVTELPKTISGKIRRVEIRENYKGD